MFDDKKKSLEVALKLCDNISIDIENINSVYFEICCETYPITLLEYAVQLIRDKNIPIIWYLPNIHYRAEDSNLYLYKKEHLWTLICNQDQLYLPVWTEQEFIELYEQLLQLISHVQLAGIYFRTKCSRTEQIEEIFENIKKVTKTAVYSYQYPDETPQ
jgi:hypothetical protein